MSVRFSLCLTLLAVLAFTYPLTAAPPAPPGSPSPVAPNLSLDSTRALPTDASFLADHAFRASDFEEERNDEHTAKCRIVLNNGEEKRQGKQGEEYVEEQEEELSFKGCIPDQFALDHDYRILEGACPLCSKLQREPGGPGNPRN